MKRSNISFRRKHHEIKENKMKLKGRHVLADKTEVSWLYSTKITRVIFISIEKKQFDVKIAHCTQLMNCYFIFFNCT